MKLRLSIRSLSSPSNRDRFISIYALHPTCRPRILISSPHYPRRKLRLITSKSPRQRRLLILHLSILTCRSRHLLRFILLSRNMKPRRSNPYPYNSNRLYRLRPSMRTNKILGRNSNHQPAISSPLYWRHPSRVAMRRLRRRQRYS